MMKNFRSGVDALSATLAKDGDKNSVSLNGVGVVTPKKVKGNILMAFAEP
jgi:hypothetical protein